MVIDVISVCGKNKSLPKLPMLYNALQYEKGSYRLACSMALLTVMVKNTLYNIGNVEK